MKNSGRKNNAIPSARRCSRAGGPFLGAMVTDLDGPLLLAEDREHALTFDEAGVHPPVAELWG